MRAFVDQINDGMATLLLGEHEEQKITLQLAWLPAGTREGSVLQLAFRLDEDAARDARQDVQHLLDSLRDDK